MSRERLPPIGSSESKTRVHPPVSSQANRRKRNQQQTTSSSSSSHPPQGPSSILLSDSTMTPWGGLTLSESSFTSIAAPAPSCPPPPAPPPAPQPTPSTPFRGTQNEEEEALSFNCEIPSPALTAFQNSAVGGTRGLQARRRMLPHRRAPRPPRLPPLRPVTNLSFSRSFTFSFFELPLHQSPCCRAERIRNLMLLLRQIRY